MIVIGFGIFFGVRSGRLTHISFNFVQLVLATSNYYAGIFNFPMLEFHILLCLNCEDVFLLHIQWCLWNV